MSTLVICLVVVGAAFVVVNRSYDPPKSATDDRPPDRGPVGERAPAVDAPAVDAPAVDAPPQRLRAPRHLRPRRGSGAPADQSEPDVWPERTLRPMAPPVGLSVAERVRSGALLVLLLVVMGLASALVVGLVVIAVVTALRTAIG